jgi:hypothetical protein
MTPVNPDAMFPSWSPSPCSSGATDASASRSCRPSATSRCWAPSCRSRSTRRRASSAAATIRAREAISSARVAALAIAVATRSAKSLMRASVSGGNDSGCDEPSATIPHTCSSTMIGTATVECRPIFRSRAAMAPGAVPDSATSSRAGRPVRKTLVARDAAPFGVGYEPRLRTGEPVVVTADPNRILPASWNLCLLAIYKLP